MENGKFSNYFGYFATETQQLLSESKLRYVQQLKCCISDWSCIFLDFDRVSSSFSFTVNFSPWSSSPFSFTQLWLIQRDKFSQACDHFGAFSLCYFILFVKGWFLLGSIDNHDCKILHLGEEWVINTFVNLSIEKLAWYPCSFSATEFDIYLI